MPLTERPEQALHGDIERWLLGMRAALRQGHQPQQEHIDHRLRF